MTPIHINREMFTQKEQDEIINNFLDVIKVRDYIRESRGKRDKCKCRDCKKHDHYCTLYELPLPENIINNIYGFTYRCYDCEKRKDKEEELEERLEINDLCLFDVDKLILSLERIFPLYDSVKHVITNITMKRYNMFKKLFNEMMFCRDKKEIKEWIQYKMKYNINATAYDFNKIVRTLLNKPVFDLLA